MYRKLHHQIKIYIIFLPNFSKLSHRIEWNRYFTQETPRTNPQSESQITVYDNSVRRG